MEREVGGGIGMGNTCISKADSCQCMTKTTTIKKKKKKRNELPMSTGHLSQGLHRVGGLAESDTQACWLCTSPDSKEVKGTSYSCSLDRRFKQQGDYPLARPNLFYKGVREELSINSKKSLLRSRNSSKVFAGK